MSNLEVIGKDEPEREVELDEDDLVVLWEDDSALVDIREMERRYRRSTPPPVPPRLAKGSRSHRAVAVESQVVAQAVLRSLPRPDTEEPVHVRHLATAMIAFGAVATLLVLVATLVVVFG